MTNAQVLDAFLNRKKAESLNMRTDGERLWSYETVVAQWYRQNVGGFTFLDVVVNARKYSRTTSKQCSRLYHGNFRMTSTNDIPFCVQDLRPYIKEVQ